MSKRLQEDLRRIVGFDESGLAISKQEEKKPIPGGRGIVYFDANGNSQVAKGTPPVVNDDGTVDPGTTQPGGGDSSGGTSGGGSNGGNTLPPGSEPTPIADGAEGDGVYSPDSDAGVIDANLGDTVKGVGGLSDCESGDPVDLRFDGEFSAPNGCGEPPEDYQEGYYWNSGDIGGWGSSSASTASASIDVNIDYWRDQGYTITLIGGLTCVAESGGECTQYRQQYNRTLGMSDVDTSETAVRQSCGASTADYCTIPPPGTPTDPWSDANTPPNTEWPEGYEEGFYWTANLVEGTDPASSAINYLNSISPLGDGSVLEFTGIGKIVDAAYIYYYTRTYLDTTVTNHSGNTVRSSCGASTEDYCTIPPPKQPDPNAKWPSCKPTQLSYNNETAKFETNQYDDNVLPKFSQPVSQVTLCNEAGDTIKTFPTADGGQVIFNQDNNIGVFLDDKGKVTGYGDGPAVTARQPR